MRNLDFSNYNENNKEYYYWTYRISKLKSDIISCIRLIIPNQPSSLTTLYISQQLIVHVNEGYKLVKDILSNRDSCFQKILKKNSKILNKLLSEIDFTNTISDNNKILKDFRDDIIHYKNSDRKDLAEFDKVVKSIKKLNYDFSGHFESEEPLLLESQMLLYNRNIIQKGLTIEGFSKVLWSNASVIIEVCNEFLDFINEEKLLE